METWQAILFKVLLMLATAPAWYPFLKAVWEELNQSMEEEGGLFGRMPTARELEEIEKNKLQRPDPLIHEPWPSAEERQRARRNMASSDQRATGDANSKAAGPAPRRSGF